MSDLREKISAAAQELYLRDGIEGLSMRRVAERVGVSAPAIYRHYENKDALLREIVIEGLKVLERYLAPAYDAPTPLERLTQLVDNYLSFAVEQPRFFDFAFLIPNREIDRLADEVAKPMWGAFRMAIEQVQACMEQGVIEPGDPLEASIALWAEAHGLVTLFRTGRLGSDTEAFREVYRRSVRRVLVGLAPRS